MITQHCNDTARTRQALSVLGAFLTFCTALSTQHGFAEETVVEILKTREWSADGKVPTGTIWRSFKVWKNDEVKTKDGKLIEVDIRSPQTGLDKNGKKAKYLGARNVAKVIINPAKHFIHTPNPAKGWQAVDFDDASWDRDAHPQRALYGMVKLHCLRGTFTVTDPQQAGPLSLRVRYRGGAVVYLNGKELGRGHLPKGEIAPDTMAEEYPKEAYIDANGKLITQGMSWGGGHPNKGAEQRTNLYNMKKEVGLTHWNQKGYSIDFDHAHRFWFSKSKDPDVLKKYRSRTRTLEFTIKPEQMIKGMNVLAVEIHRAPAWEGMFTTRALPLQSDGGHPVGVCWDRCEIEDILLTGKSATGIAPNIKAPDAPMVFNFPVNVSLSPAFYGDPNDKLQPVRIYGARNGTYAGQLVVTGKEIKNLKVTVTDLKGPATLPADKVEIRYPKIMYIKGIRGKKRGHAGSYFDLIDTSVEPSITELSAHGGRKFSAKQPIRFSVKIPRDAAPGKYIGTISIQADGLKVTTPLELSVVGSWVMPDSKDFKTIGAFLESPDAIANHYGIKMWSPEHWKMIDMIFEVLGQVGNKTVFIPLICKTHLGNEHSMVHYIKQPDGSYKPDFSIAEKYLDLAIKHCGDLKVVCLWVGHGHKVKDRNPKISVKDPKTGELSEFKPANWNTPESVKFWKPVIEASMAMIARRKQEKAIMFGLIGDSVGPDFPDIHSISPSTKWIISSHWEAWRFKAKTKDGKKLKGPEFTGAWSSMHGYFFRRMNWMGDIDGEPTFTWRPDATSRLSRHWDKTKSYIRLGGMRSRTPLLTNDNTADVNRLSIAMESLRLSNGIPFHGYGLFGADIWNGEMRHYDNYHRVGIDQNTFLWVAAPGKDGPVPSCRAKAIQMSLQEAELRMFVQDAILDSATTSKLSPDLAQRIKKACDARSKMLSFMARWRYNSSSGHMPELRLIYDLAAWQKSTIDLYQLADEINKAIGKGN